METEEWYSFGKYVSVSSVHIGHSRGDVPKWLMGRFAKPFSVSSILTVTSKFLSGLIADSPDGPVRSEVSNLINKKPEEAA